MRFWIDMKNANLGRICTKVRQNFVPFKIGEIFELRDVYGSPGEAMGSAAWLFSKKLNTITFARYNFTFIDENQKRCTTSAGTPKIKLI